MYKYIYTFCFVMFMFICTFVRTKITTIWKQNKIYRGVINILLLMIF